jgi:hypothetical protein
MNRQIFVKRRVTKMSNKADRFNKVKPHITNRKPKETGIPSGPAVKIQVSVETLKGNVVGKACAYFYSEETVRIFLIPKLKNDQNYVLRKKSKDHLDKNCGTFFISEVIKEGLMKNEYMLQKI